MRPAVVFLLVYCALYVLLLLGGLRKRLTSSRAPRWLLPVEIIAYGSAVAGMLIYALGDPRPFFKTVWAFVCAVILVVMALDALYDYRELVQKPDTRVSAKESLVFSALGSLVAVLFQVPCLWVNFRLAFG